MNEYPAESRAMSSVAENVSVIAAGPDAVLMLLGVILNPVRRGGTLSPANNEVSWRRNAAKLHRKTTLTDGLRYWRLIQVEEDSARVDVV